MTILGKRKLLKTKISSLQKKLNQNLLKAKRALLQKQLNSFVKDLAVLNDIISGDKPSDVQAKLMKTQKHSFAVEFERKKALKKVRSPGSVCKSLRRFTSLKEATHHAKRFTKKHKHKGFKVTKVKMRANAWVNWLTGKTNPILTK